jgi:hypothetical protein
MLDYFYRIMSQCGLFSFMGIIFIFLSYVFVFFFFGLFNGTVFSSTGLIINIRLHQYKSELIPLLQMLNDKSWCSPSDTLPYHIVAPDTGFIKKGYWIYTSKYKAHRIGLLRIHLWQQIMKIFSLNDFPRVMPAIIRFRAFCLLVCCEKTWKIEYTRW